MNNIKETIMDMGWDITEDDSILTISNEISTDSMSENVEYSMGSDNITNVINSIANNYSLVSEIEDIIGSCSSDDELIEFIELKTKIKNELIDLNNAIEKSLM